MRKLLWLAIAVSLLTLIVVGCGGQPQAPQVVKETVIVQGTPQVVEKVVTPTPVPPTAPRPRQRSDRKTPSFLPCSKSRMF